MSFQVIAIAISAPLLWISRTELQRKQKLPQLKLLTTSKVNDDLKMKADMVKKLMEKGYRVKCRATGSDMQETTGAES
ncbi:hypothetical protein AAHE18_19G194200 [Arachis hypogaea]